MLRSSARSQSVFLFYVMFVVLRTKKKLNRNLPDLICPQALSRCKVYGRGSVPRSQPPTLDPVAFTPATSHPRKFPALFPLFTCKVVRLCFSAPATSCKRLFLGCFFVHLRVNSQKGVEWKMLVFLVNTPKWTKQSKAERMHVELSSFSHVNLLHVKLKLKIITTRVRPTIDLQLEMAISTSAVSFSFWLRLPVQYPEVLRFWHAPRDKCSLSVSASVSKMTQDSPLTFPLLISTRWLRSTVSYRDMRNVFHHGQWESQFINCHSPPGVGKIH